MDGWVNGFDHGVVNPITRKWSPTATPIHRLRGKGHMWTFSQWDWWWHVPPPRGVSPISTNQILAVSTKRTPRGCNRIWIFGVGQMKKLPIHDWLFVVWTPRRWGISILSSVTGFARKCNRKKRLAQASCCRKIHSRVAHLQCVCLYFFLAERHHQVFRKIGYKYLLDWITWWHYLVGSLLFQFFFVSHIFYY